MHLTQKEACQATHRLGQQTPFPFDDGKRDVATLCGEA